MSSEVPINWPEDGLIPVIIQDDETNDVLMMGFMNHEALTRTRESGEVHFWSRSRQTLWHKGGSSGNVQHVRTLSINCDRNSLLILVNQEGAVCHDGYASCYYRDILDDGSLATNQDREFDPRDVYGDGLGLEGLTRRWWGAFRWLREHDLEAVSRTSKLLRTPGATVLDRIKDELVELSGVLDGTHRHQEPHADFLLESSQCCYWIVVQCLLDGLSFEDVRPDRAIDVTEASVDAQVASVILLAESKALESFSATIAGHLLHLIAESARTMEIDPRAIIERDLGELESKPYLAAYFAE